jgi:hypothetical protein
LLKSADSTPVSDDTDHADVDTSGSFNASAAPNPAQLADQMSQMMHDFRETSDQLSFEELHRLQKDLETLTRTVQSQKVPVLLERMRAQIGAVSDPEAPEFGKQFLAAMDASACGIRLDSGLKNSAMYNSFSYGKTTRGFVNEVALNPSRVDKEDRFISSTAHEYIHSFQKRVSPALQRSPFNPESRVVIHPADWIILEGLCERDAYTKQALLNSLLAKTNPAVKGSTDFDVVSVSDFEKMRGNAGSLADAVVTSALDSLSKPIVRGQPNGRTFVHHYQDVALDNYSAGMAKRKEERENDIVFVRVEFEDLWQIGNYGVGPNSFGENVHEPLIEKRHKLSAGAQEKLDRICREHNIPPLESCPTLRAYDESLAFTRAQTQTVQTSASAPFLAP